MVAAWNFYLFIYFGDGDACGLRNTMRLIGLVEDKRIIGLVEERGLLLCWRKGGSG